MGLQIDDLLERYWNGETTLKEEVLIKAHFKSSPSLSNERHYFRYLSKQSETNMEEAKLKVKRKTWVSAVATVTIGLIAAFLVMNNANKDPFAVEDSKEAFEATRKALMMIGAGLNQGQMHAMELTKINKVKEEFQEERFKPAKQFEN